MSVSACTLDPIDNTSERLHATSYASDAKPEIDHTRYRSPEELKEHALAHIRDAVSLLRSKAQPEELDEYRRFVMNLSRKVADAHREGGRGEDATSEDEQRALADVEQALG